MTENERIDSYNILRLIGRGLTGELFVGRHIMLNEDRAVKTFFDETISVDGFGERFYSLAPKLSKLKHPYIVHLYDMDIDGYRYYMITEFVSPDGVTPMTLQDLLDTKPGGRVSVAEAAVLLRQIGAALDYAHTRGILHGNLKPSNILMDGGQNIQIADFGLARIVGEEYFRSLIEVNMSDDATLDMDELLPVPKVPAKSLVETMMCLAPEVREPKGVWTNAADIYSIGVLAYWLVTGKQPHRESFIKPSAINSAVPEQWDEVVQRAMSADPAARYETAEALVLELTREPQASEAPTEPVIVIPVPTPEPEPVVESSVEPEPEPTPAQPEETPAPEVAAASAAPAITPEANLPGKKGSGTPALITFFVGMLVFIVVVCLIFVKTWEKAARDRSPLTELAAPTPLTELAAPTPAPSVAPADTAPLVATMTQAPAATDAADRPQGNGTVADPFQLAEMKHLQWLDRQAEAGLTAGKVYKLMTDLDAAPVKTQNNGAGFDPIGTAERAFEGTFEGDNRAVSNLSVNRPGTAGCGLFAANRGKIADVILRNVNINGQDNVGALVGNNAGQIDRCFAVGGNVRGTNGIGGLVGANSATVRLSSFSGMVVGAKSVGGFVGLNTGVGGSISESSAAAAIAGAGDYTGGFAGYNLDAKINACYAAGAGVKGSGWVGGFVGANRGKGVIADCYAECGILGKTNVGGFIGIGEGESVTERCYASGAAKGNTNVGGFAGRRYGNATVNDCFWNTQTSELLLSAAGKGKSAAEMKAAATFAAWDFRTIWKSEVGAIGPTLRRAMVPLK